MQKSSAALFQRLNHFVYKEPGVKLSYTQRKRLRNAERSRRRAMERNMARKEKMMAKEMAKKEMAIACLSGVSPNLAVGSFPHNEETHKRGNIAGDTLEMATKKQRQGSHSQAPKKAFVLRVVCKDYSRVISSDDVDHLTSVIDDRIIEETVPCQVHETYLQSDGFHMVCGDRTTIGWLKETIDQLPGPTGTNYHPGYRALVLEDRPLMKQFFAWVPGYRDPSKTLKILGTCNENLDIRKITIKSVIPGSGGQTLVLGVEQDLVGYLAARSNSLFCGGIGSIQLKEPNS